jgi:hypothetical protein
MIKHFFYYIPNLKAGPEAKGAIHRVIGSSIAGAELRCANTTHGPGQSGPGVLVAALPEGALVPAGEVERRLQYCADPARQAWMEAAGFWVGYDEETKPGPVDLERRKFVAGYEHICPDTGRWVVPLAREVEGGTKMDQRIVYLPDRTTELRPVQRYENLCAFAAEHFAYLSGVDADESGQVVTFNQRFADVACEALCVNYYVGPYELSLLGVLTRDASTIICGLLCDWPGLVKILMDRNAEKKMESAETPSSTNSGETAA